MLVETTATGFRRSMEDGHIEGHECKITGRCTCLELSRSEEECSSLSPRDRRSSYDDGFSSSGSGGSTSGRRKSSTSFLIEDILATDYSPKSDRHTRRTSVPFDQPIICETDVRVPHISFSPERARCVALPNYYPTKIYPDLISAQYGSQFRSRLTPVSPYAPRNFTSTISFLPRYQQSPHESLFRDNSQYNDDVFEAPDEDHVTSSTECNSNGRDFGMMPKFDWLQCTRYRPPKVPRTKRRSGSTMRTSRQPRIPFTPYQQATLEKHFQMNHYLTAHAVTELAIILNLSKQRIKIWYQNRRARERREELQKEEESASSKT